MQVSVAVAVHWLRGTFGIGLLHVTHVHAPDGLIHQVRVASHLHAGTAWQIADGVVGTLDLSDDYARTLLLVGCSTAFGHGLQIAQGVGVESAEVIGCHEAERVAVLYRHPAEELAHLFQYLVVVGVVVGASVVVPLGEVHRAELVGQRGGGVALVGEGELAISRRACDVGHLHYELCEVQIVRALEFVVLQQSEVAHHGDADVVRALIPWLGESCCLKIALPCHRALPIVGRCQSHHPIHWVRCQQQLCIYHLSHDGDVPSLRSHGCPYVIVILDLRDEWLSARLQVGHGAAAIGDGERVSHACE